jgi:diguanylate cyclase (GGDEF)-like protein
MQLPRRRASDGREHCERRTFRDRRRQRVWSGQMRFPDWPEQKIQFLTRYLFLVLGIVFFNFSHEFKPAWFTLPQLNAAFAAYLVFNSLAFAHAHARPDSVLRYRVAMWVDVALVSVCVLNDPYDIPPSLLVFIMVVLGNGMRYGMRLFGEALTGSFAGAMIALSFRSAGNAHGLTPGVMFLNLFGGIILVYAYILMSRIEVSRQTLERQSSVDILTGLLNRRALFEKAHELFEDLGEGKTLVAMFADLDKFKAINDTYGHAAGDEVLKQFAGILRDYMRSSDVAARFGGDEFVLLLPDTSLAAAKSVAARLRAETVAWSRINKIDVSVTIGLGEAPTHGRDLATLLDQVDQAMYRSKSDPGCTGLLG